MTEPLYILDPDKVRALREGRDLTHAQAARRAGLADGRAWDSIESGRGAGVTLATLARMAMVVSCKPRDLLKPVGRG